MFKSISRYGKYAISYQSKSHQYAQTQAVYTKLRNCRQNSSTAEKARVIFSGIQPTGVPHLGNYLGAVREWVRLQNDAAPGTKLVFSIVDLHALTVPQDPGQLRNWRKEMFATLLAAGLDPKKSTIFYQSTVRDVAFGSHLQGCIRLVY